jgi:hypothetical protein
MVLGEGVSIMEWFSPSMGFVTGYA